MTALRREVVIDLTSGSEAPDVSVVIVTYNSRRFIDDCLGSIEAAAGHLVVETIVVDNASLDGSGDHIETAWPEVRLIRTGWNSGFSRACNVGAAAATGQHLLFLNGDAVLAQHAIRDLVAAFDGLDGAGVIAPRVLNPDGSDQNTARSFPTPAAFAFGRRSPLTRRFPNNRYSQRYLSGANPDTIEPFEIDWVSGAALMIERGRFAGLGGFDEGFFMYWEDADLCHRVKDSGASVWCLPTAIATHAEGSSASTTSKVQNQRFHRSAYRYLAKHMLRGPAAVLRPVARLALCARSTGVAIARHRTTDTASPAPSPIAARS